MDVDHIAKLVSLGSTSDGVLKAQGLAKIAMDANGYGPTLHNACAATLSEFLNLADIHTKIELNAGKLAGIIKGRGWETVAVGKQNGGDVAVAKNNIHIFLVINAVDNDNMVIADNQAPGPHARKASGTPALNHSPVSYFLRAPGKAAKSDTVPLKIDVFTGTPDSSIYPRGDESTDDLVDSAEQKGSDR